MNARKYKIRKEVDLREPIRPPKKKGEKKDYMGENASTTPDFMEKVHQGVARVRP